jgi:hypothetical protein
MKCPNCDYEHDKLISLSLHWRRMHKETSEALRIKLFHDNVRPTCACGCGTSVKFHTVEKGFSQYAWGHASSVNNNWGHNKSALDKSHVTNKARLKSGENVIWNKGLTIEDSRVAAYGRAGSHTLKTNPECQEQRSKHMANQWETNSIVSLRGSDHPNWHGGASKVHNLARSLVHNVWTYPKLKEANFTCTRCGSKKDLCVHHDKIYFHQILREAISTLGEVTDDSDFELKSRIAEWVADYHVQNSVSGIVLCEPCHQQEHASLNF